MANLFKDAKFGDKYITKNGRIALYIERHCSLCDHILLLQGNLSYNVYSSDGDYSPQGPSPLDIFRKIE